MSLSMRVSNHLRGLTNLLYDNTLICYYSESRIYTHTCAHTISVHLCVGLCVLFAGILFISALCLCVQRLLVAWTPCLIRRVYVCQYSCLYFVCLWSDINVCVCVCNVCSACLCVYVHAYVSMICLCVCVHVWDPATCVKPYSHMLFFCVCGHIRDLSADVHWGPFFED